MSDVAPHLEHPIPPGRRAEWARELAEVPPDGEKSQHESFYVVRVGDEWFGLPPGILGATLPDARPRKIPHRSHTLVEGLVNWDGRLIVCLALERLLGVLGTATAKDAGRLLVVQWKGWTGAIRVPFVLGVESLDLAAIQPLPASAPEVLARSARGVVLYQNRSMVCLEGDAFVEQLKQAVR